MLPRVRISIAFERLERGECCCSCRNAHIYVKPFCVAHCISLTSTARSSARGEIAAPTGYAPGHEPSEEHVEGLTAKPFWNVDDEPELFPWAAGLQENANVIANEFEEKLKRDKQMFTSDSAWQNQVMGSGWSAIRLQRLGVWNIENCNEFPQTYQLLRSLNIPLAVRGVCFARQAPGSGVQPHSDGRNFILTSHLGLKVPEGVLA